MRDFEPDYGREYLHSRACMYSGIKQKVGLIRNNRLF